MKNDQMSEEVRKIYDGLLNKTRPEINRYQRKVVTGSIVVFLVVLGAVIWYWISPTVAYSTSLLIGGQLYALYGALLLAVGALSSPSTLGLMCITFPGGNSKLFAALMRSRFTARVGVYFIVGGFSIQAAVTLLF